MTRADQPPVGFTTRQVHAGGPGQRGVSPRATPVYLTAGFRFEEYEQAGAHFGDGAGYGYTRTGNPTIEATERTIAALEGGVEALLLATGQAATTIALLSVASSGHRLLAASSLYEGTRGLFLDNFPRLGIETDFVEDAQDLERWARRITPQTRALFLESIPNARNDLVDIAAVADLAHAHDLPLVVDNTLATPYLMRPIEHGADLVVHSASKFLAGHGTVLGGVVVDNGGFDPERGAALFPHLVASPRGGGSSAAARHGGRARIAFQRETIAPRLGPTLSPWNAFLIAQGIETLSLRVARHSEVALQVATWLDHRPEVASVDYCGLASHPQHALARRYLPHGQGAVFTFTLDGEEQAARRFIEALELFTHMTHLGDVRSLVLHPASTSHVLRSPAEQAAAGVLPGTVRLSVGIEDPEDLIADLERGLAAAQASGVSR